MYRFAYMHLVSFSFHKCSSVLFVVISLTFYRYGGNGMVYPWVSDDAKVRTFLKMARLVNKRKGLAKYFNLKWF